MNTSVVWLTKINLLKWGLFYNLQVVLSILLCLTKLFDASYKWSLRWKAQHNFSFKVLLVRRDSERHFVRMGQRSPLRQRRVWTANILGDNIILECICGALVNETENGWVHPRHVNADDDNRASRKHNRLRNRKSVWLWHWAASKLCVRLRREGDL